MSLSQNQTYRVLSMYDRLSKGHALTKKGEADSFQVGEKTIQRDFESIRAFLETAKTNEYLEYDRKDKIYKLEVGDEHYLRNEEIFTLAKILIESRAFPKADMDRLIDKLTNLAQPANQDFIKKLMLNEKHLYVDLQHKKSLFSLLWELAQAVHTKRVINVCYKREHDQESSERTLKPVGLLFSDYYFYLIAYQTKHELEFPTIYRVDRMTACHVTDEHFQAPYHNRFQEGEFRKRIQFMHAGELMTIRFRFTGPSPQAVLDRLPTARIIEEGESGMVFEAEVFGRGIKMWLLSQGEYVEVLGPQVLRDEMRRSVMDMVKNY
ncbi:helix-turn-helix transcriptional regulator [Metabacillus iocasae]|uniref:DNA-binding transcriptional regulator YafY n=1 Tax=Priestia iocasae TaxID=2291674 RepID=A0ABS2QVE7_9BACI|nr:WYL domain-containing protein [Metabacillus iocasae]MBM7702912.1 putative DNA-binding transcriptional regulator YafY [Metabacillus iocasae]